jgi:hypothetical protein
LDEEWRKENGDPAPKCPLAGQGQAPPLPFFKVPEVPKVPKKLKMTK